MWLWPVQWKVAVSAPFISEPFITTATLYTTLSSGSVVSVNTPPMTVASSIATWCCTQLVYLRNVRTVIIARRSLATCASISAYIPTDLSPSPITAAIVVIIAPQTRLLSGRMYCGIKGSGHGTAQNVTTVLSVRKKYSNMLSKHTEARARLDHPLPRI